MPAASTITAIAARLSARRRLVAGVVAGILLLGGVSGMFVLGRELQAIEAYPPAPCYLTLPLTPETRPGAPWQQHRHRLTPAAVDLPDGLSYLVWNQRTGQMFRWLHDTTAPGEPHILVPTRYTSFHNRGWHDDPWAYCLVLAPEPPFRDHNHGFASWMQAGTPLAAPGALVSVTATVIADESRRVLVNIEIRDPNGVRVARWTYPDQELRAKHEASYTGAWSIPTGAALGIYTIQLEVFVPGRTTPRHWNAGTVIIVVR